MSDGPGTATERAALHATALRARGHTQPERYTYVDSATNIDISSSRAHANRVEEIPVDSRPHISGVGGGTVPTHYVYRSVPEPLRLPGVATEYRTVWSPDCPYNIISTDTLGRLGLDTFTVSAEGGQMYLSPSGADPRDKTTRVRCVRTNGLHALPYTVKALAARSAGNATTRLPPGLNVPKSSGGQTHSHSGGGEEPTAFSTGDTVTRTPSRVSQPQDSPGQTCSRNDGGDEPDKHMPPLDTCDMPNDECSMSARGANGASTHANTETAGKASGTPEHVAGVEYQPVTRADSVTTEPGRAKQRRPVPYAQFRQRLGNASHNETMHAAKRMGVRLIGSEGHRSRLDHERATANQIATAARRVTDPGIFPRARTTVITDTVGPMPMSALGNRYLQSWFIKGRPGHITVTCAPDKSAAASWRGFQVFAQEHGIELQRDAIYQSLEVVHDCGTEYLKEFLAESKRAGFAQRSATPHKNKKFEAHPSEGANRLLEAQTRINIVGARARFAAWDMDARRYWDRAVKYGAIQIAVRFHCRDHDIGYDQMVRELIAPGFGALGTVKVQAGDTSHRQPGGKQLADRSVPGLFIGATPNHKCIMLLRDASVMVTSDVSFPIEETINDTSELTNAATNDEWARDIAAAFGSEQRGASAAAESSLGAAPEATVSGKQPNTKPNTVPSRTSDQSIRSDAGRRSQPGDSPVKWTDRRNSGEIPSTKPGQAESEIEVLTGSESNLPAKVQKQQSDSPSTTEATPTVEAPMESDADASDDEPTFVDHEGKTVSIGDRIAVERGGAEQYGVVTDIDRSDQQTPGGEVRVDFADGTDDYEYYPLQPHRRAPMRKRFDAATHRALVGVWSRPVCLRLAATSPPRAPHPSVAEYLDSAGNILPQYLDGTATLPPAPPLPGPEARIITPITTEEALSLPEALFWLHSHIGELRGHLSPTNRPPTFHYTTERPRGRRLHVKFIYKVKRRQDDTIEKFKGRAVIAGWWLKRGVHYADSYTGQSPWSDVRDLESLGVSMRLRVYEADLVQAFPFASMPPAPNGEPVIAEMPTSSKIFTKEGAEMFVHADQAWYGHPAAGNALAELLCRVFTGRGVKSGEERCTVRLVQHPAQPVVFVAQHPPGHEWHGEVFWLHVSTDNLRTYTSCDAMQHEFMEWCDRNFQTTGGRVALQDQEPQTFNGVRFSYINGAVQLDMPAYIAQLLDEVGLSHANPASTPMAMGTVLRLGEAPRTASDQLAVVESVNKVFNTGHTLYSEIVTYYSHLVSSVGWIASKVGPILLLPHSVLCRSLAAPTKAAFTALKRVLRFLAGNQNLHVTYKPDREYDWRRGDYPVYEMQSDASYADDPDDRRSQGAFTGGFRHQAITTAESKKGHRVATSTDQAEAQHAGSACKHAEYKRNFLGFLGVPTDQPTTLSVDNYATYLRNSCSVRKWSPASKQLDVLERYIVECVERNIVKLQHSSGHLPEHPQPGEGFKVDALTKVLPMSSTNFYHRELHGPDLISAAPGRG
jgi:hypothetical protein